MHFRHPKQRLVQPKQRYKRVKQRKNLAKQRINLTKQRKKGSKPLSTYSLLISIVTYLSLPLVFPPVELQA